MIQRARSMSSAAHSTALNDHLAYILHNMSARYPESRPGAKMQRDLSAHLHVIYHT